MRTTAELRAGYRDFFESKGHVFRPSAPLIPRADDRSTLLVSASDKLHNVRSIVRDYRVLHDAVWRRFSPDAGMPGTIGYYRGLVAAFRRRQSDGTPQFPRLVDELDLEATTLETLAGHTGQWPLP